MVANHIQQFKFIARVCIAVSRQLYAGFFLVGTPAVAKAQPVSLTGPRYLVLAVTKKLCERTIFCRVFPRGPAKHHVLVVCVLVHVPVHVLSAHDLSVEKWMQSVSVKQLHQPAMVSQVGCYRLHSGHLLASIL